MPMVPPEFDPARFCCSVDTKACSVGEALSALEVPIDAALCAGAEFDVTDGTDVVDGEFVIARSRVSMPAATPLA